MRSYCEKLTTILTTEKQRNERQVTCVSQAKRIHVMKSYCTRTVTAVTRSRLKPTNRVEAGGSHVTAMRPEPTSAAITTMMAIAQSPSTMPMPPSTQPASLQRRRVLMPRSGELSAHAPRMIACEQSSTNFRVRVRQRCLSANLSLEMNAF